MDYSNKEKLQTIILFIFLVIFPFGQLLKMSFQPIDLVVGLAFLYTIIFSLRTPKAVAVLRNFLLAAGFSLLFSFSFFKAGLLFIGFLYLLRLTFYAYFVSFVFNFSKGSGIRKNVLVNGLIAVSFFSAVFGWIQYFWFPDFRPFTVFGWDDHLYRLIGTFLDPGFTSIVVVFGIIAVLYKYFSTKNRKLVLLITFFIFSLAFTYSRAGYISFIAGALFLAVSEKKTKEIILMLAAFLFIVLALPRTAGEGVKLERTASTNARLLNYSETLKIIGNSPLFGIGFNNICLAKETFLVGQNQESHSCSGSDSSLLLILATTGIIGFIVFLWCLRSLFPLIATNSLYGKMLISSSVTLFIHSLFINSLFYPWVMGWMAILLAVSLKEFKE
ncbi:MAG: O-antigen ligase family protein [bacterium]